jgi:hypothetical protein
MRKIKQVQENVDLNVDTLKEEFEKLVIRYEKDKSLAFIDGDYDSVYKLIKKFDIDENLEFKTDYNEIILIDYHTYKVVFIQITIIDLNTDIIQRYMQYKSDRKFSGWSETQGRIK